MLVSAHTSAGKARSPQGPFALCPRLLLLLPRCRPLPTPACFLTSPPPVVLQIDGRGRVRHRDGAAGRAAGGLHLPAQGLSSSGEAPFLSFHSRERPCERLAWGRKCPAFASIRPPSPIPHPPSPIPYPLGPLQPEVPGPLRDLPGRGPPHRRRQRPARGRLPGHDDRDLEVDALPGRRGRARDQVGDHGRDPLPAGPREGRRLGGGHRAGPPRVPLRLPVGHHPKRPGVCRVGGQGPRAALPRGVHRLQADATAALPVPGGGGRDLPRGGRGGEIQGGQLPKGEGERRRGDCASAPATPSDTPLPSRILIRLTSCPHSRSLPARPSPS